MSPGDQITTVTQFFGEDGLRLVHTRVANVFELAPRPGFRWEDGTAHVAAGATVALQNVANDCFFDERGITWLPGWQSGEAAIALLAAAALSGGAVPTHEFGQPDSEDEYYLDGHDGMLEHEK